MPRPLRITTGGLVYHVLNRANTGLSLFRKARDYSAFEQVIVERLEDVPVDVLAYCLMPNHWHLVIRPKEDGGLSAFAGWIALTHTQRWRAHHQSAGRGHLYQGRFKSFPVDEDPHFLTVCRYAERNALRAGLVRRAERWRWCSLWRQQHHHPNAQPPLAQWPVPQPAEWVEFVNQPLTAGELTAVRRCVAREQPYGSEAWVAKVLGTRR